MRKNVKNKPAESAPAWRDQEKQAHGLRLAEFIRENTPQIVNEWESFAQTLIPAADGMSPLKLRDHIKPILAFIADDLESPQTNPEQVKKSHGGKSKNSGDSVAEGHAALRLAGGFNMDQMVSEYRALRASVIKLWQTQLAEPTSTDLADLTRFNESIDQALTESISYYTRKLDLSRNLFLGILGHDLRSPLAAARMSAELALRIGAPNLDERQTMLINQVIESADRATEIVVHLLDLTRARLGSGLPIIKEPMDIGFVARRLVEEMRAIHPDCKFNLAISGDTAGEWDKPRIGQVFSNLLGNAVQYGFKDLPIALTIKGFATEVVLSVHNEGVPIPAYTIGRIFDSLTRGEKDDTGTQPESINLGLGLYITKEIVTAHGGTIDVTSSETGGTTFTVRFPKTSARGDGQETSLDQPTPCAI